jgi:uncharacterized coiled-coil protein SlyX
MRQKAEELEAKVAELEAHASDQETTLQSMSQELSDARNRMKGNAAVVDRTKQALAVAITLLEEQFASSEEEAAQASQDEGDADVEAEG